MEAARARTVLSTPEQMIQRAVRTLRQHVLWDALLIFLPPLFVALYIVSYLYLNGWVSPILAALLGFVACAICSVAIVMRYRPSVPSARSVAHLIDDRVGAQDRFLTLATLPPSPASAVLMARLRVEAAGLQSRIALKREFPYKIKRHVYSSLLASLCVAVLFHLLLPVAHSTLSPQPAHERLRNLALQMAARPNLQEMARSLQDLAAKLEDGDIPLQEKQDLARQERSKVEKQERKESDKQNRDLLAQAAGTLEGVEQQSGAGERKNEQPGGGGSIESNLPQQGQGEGKQSQGSGNDSKGETDGQTKSDTQNGKITRGDAEAQGNEKAPGKTNGDMATQPAPENSANRSNNDRPGTTDGPGSDRDGPNKVTEEIPQSAQPAERFHKPGEGGYQGIKGAGYVTVQLPEELTANGKGSPSKTSKTGKSAPSQLPVSNVPLPKHVPDAPSEKQQMPLEYRGIIR